MTESPNDLRLVARDGLVEVIDSADGTPLLELLPASNISASRSRAGPPPPSLIALAEALNASSPHVVAMIERVRAGSGPAGDLMVRFAPQVASRLRDGSARLMITTDGRTLARAVDSATGTVIGSPQVVAPAVTSGIGGGAVAGGAAVAAGAGTAAVVLPLAIAAGAALAASWAQQRWLEQTLGGLERAIARIETRLRDDDLGSLAAADGLLGLIGDRAAYGELGPQLCTELALARHRTEAIFQSRLRFAERFKRDLEEWQVAAERDAGHPVTWTKQIVEVLVADDSATVAELVVFFQALLTRSRIDSVTASLLVTQGDSASAFRLIDEIRSSIRHDYFDLHNRLAALGKADFNASGLRKLIDRNDRKRARELVGDLSGQLDQSIGHHLPEPDQHLELLLPIEAFTGNGS